MLTTIIKWNGLGCDLAGVRMSARGKLRRGEFA